MAQKFTCSNCGESAVILGIVNIDRNGMTPCPICRAPVVTYTVTGNETAAGPKVESLGDILFLGVANVAMMLLAFAIIHALLWYVLGIDVTVWGGIALFDFRLPYFYLISLAVSFAIVAGIVIENERLKANARSR